MFNELAPTYQRLNSWLTFGIERLWRKTLFKAITKDFSQNLNKGPFHFLDLACGPGDLAIPLAKLYPASKITAMDLSEGMMNIGRDYIKKQKIQNVFFHLGDAQNIPVGPAAFDAVTIGFGIRNFPDPKKALREIARCLKPEGKLYILECAVPENLFLKKGFLLYFRHILPFLGKSLSKHPYAYQYLNETVEEFPARDKFWNFFEEVSPLRPLTFQNLTFGSAVFYQAVKQSSLTLKNQ